MNNGFTLLKENHAGAMLLMDGSTANYGVIRIENNTSLIYYTGKGLREMWSPNILTEEERLKADSLKKIIEGEGGEEKLIASGHVARIPLEKIARILF